MRSRACAPTAPEHPTGKHTLLSYYGLLAHSHSWKGPNSKPATNVELTWIASDQAHSQHPKDSLDLICVSDLGMWCPAKFTFPDPLGTARIAYTGFIPDRDYPRLKYTPIGAFMVKVYNALAWEIPSLQGLAEYFTLSGIGGNGEGMFRHWPISIYSEELQASILRGRVSGQIQKWDEWSFMFDI